MRSAFRKKFVFFYHRSHGHFPYISRAVYPYHSAFALYADAFCKGNFGRQRQRETDWRPLLDRRIQIKTNATSAYVADLCGFTMVRALTATHGNRDPKREASCGPFLLGFSHALLQANKVALNYAQEYF